MKISVKGRYGVASMVYLAKQYESGEYITVIKMAEALGVSKIYLEQVFSLLKRGNIVVSVKGAQGGYRLSSEPNQISAYDILSAIELSLFEETEETVKENAEDIEAAMQKLVFSGLDNTVKSFLEHISLQQIASEAEKLKDEKSLMFYI